MRTVQVRISEDSYELMMRLLNDKETVSDYVRDAIRLETTVRLLANETHNGSHKQ